MGLKASNVLIIISWLVLFNIQGVRMCAKEEYDVNHGLFGNNEDDGLGGLIDDIFDIPVDCLDGDEFNDDWVDWGQELGPIPLNVFSEMQTFGGTRCGGGVKMDFVSQSGCSNVGTCEPEVINPQPKPIYSQEQAYRIPKPVEAQSPDSVLENGMSTSSRKNDLFGTEIVIPVRTRTKRSASGSTTNSWLKLLQQSPFQKVKKIRKKAKAIQHDVNEVKKCSHCEITKTPQWREGPTGPKSLCNACGVRYRSGRLFPEYRPAASPTFVPSLHSNSHRRVVAMRQKGTAMNDDDNYFVKKHMTSNVESQHSRLWS